MPVGVYPHKKGWHHTEETKAKLSFANGGRIMSSEWRDKMREAKLKNPIRYWLGKTRPPVSLETREKLREVCKRNGNKPPVRRGEANNKWKGGISRGYKTGYYSTEYKIWRKSIFERDNYTCQVCRKVGVYLTAHHIKSFAHYPKLRFDVNNGITLCEDCHKLTDNYKGRNINKEVSRGVRML